MKRIIKTLISSVFVFGIIIFSTHFIYAAENNKPVVETKISPEGSSVRIILPKDFSGKVMTECRNGVCISTSSPVTDKDIQEMKKRMERQIREMEDFFRQQEEQVRKVFNNEWAWNW